MKPFDCMPAVRTPEAFQDTCRLRILDFCLPLRATGSATSTTFDFGAIFPFTFVPAYKSPCLRFAVTVTGHHARLGTRPLARLCRGGHPRPLNFMRLQGAMLIKPDVPIAGIRLSDRLHGKAHGGVPN